MVVVVGHIGGNIEKRSTVYQAETPRSHFSIQYQISCDAVSSLKDCRVTAKWIYTQTRGR